MDKLIELLNEYESVKPTIDYSWRIERRNQTRMCGTEYTGAYVNEEETERIVISKKYKFIKRLVENDKINFDACEGEKTYNNLTASRDSNYTQYERLLMSLSIQDNPIEFLISILK